MPHLPATPRSRLSLSIRHALIASLLAGTPALPVWAATTQPAQQEQARSYAIPAGNLDQVLNRFASESGILLSADGQLTAGKHSPGLSGSYGVGEGLARLLMGTGLQAVNAGGNYALEVAVDAAGAMELSSVTISGKAPGSITEGTGSYTTYSTSSATRLNLSPKETPQSITVMTSQRLEDQQLTSIEKVLDATPGVNVLHVSGYGTGVPTITTRGSTLNSYQMDGIQTSSSLQAYLQSTAIYDRIEVVRGATGLMNSLGSPAATVNMIRKRPTYEFQGSVTGEAGNWSRYGSGLDLSGPLTETGNVRGRVVVDYKNQGAWVDNFNQESMAVYGIGEIDLNDSTLLTVGASHTTRNTQAPVGRMPLFYSNGQKVDFSPEDNANPSWAYYDHELVNAFASIEHRFNSEWSAKAEYNYTEYNAKALYGVLGTLSRPGAGSNITSLLREQPTHRQSTFDSYITGSFGLFGREHQLIAGLTLSDQDSHVPSLSATYSSGSYYVADYFNYADTLAKPDSLTQTGKSTTEETQKSAYISARFSLSDATTLLLGGRVTDWERDIDTLTYSSNSKTERVNKRSGLFVPYAGLVQDLNENWSVYASYTKIFNPQLARYLDINNNPLLPEEGISYEAGIKSSFNEGKLNASLAIYKTELDNRALWYTLGNRTIYYGEDGTVTKGVELEFSGELTEGWQVGAGYSFNVIRDSDGERLSTHVPQRIAKTFTTYRLPGALNKLTVGGGVDWNSRVKNNNFTQGSYAVTNLLARYEINSHLTASVNFNNVFNKEYMSSYSTWGSYAPPRNFMTSIKYTF